jgi:hypothetical protein
VCYNGKRLAELRIERGPWTVGERFAAVETAHDWGLTPSQFWAASEDDQAYMMAYTRSVGQMARYERQVQEPPRRSGIRLDE